MNVTDNQKDSNTAPALWDTLLVDVRIATMTDLKGYGIIEQGAIGIRDGRIVWVGTVEALPGKSANDVIECGHMWITPGLIDCHNHLMYGGYCPQPLESVIKATRAMTEDHLLEVSARRLVSLLEEGVTAVGITSGYGLDKKTEIKLESVVRLLEDILPMHLLTKFDGERMLPEAYAGNKDAFSEQGVKALAAAGQAALLLPGVFYMRGLTQRPLVDLLREHGVPMLLATDCNPLTSPSTSLLLMMNMGCRFFGLTPVEALQAVTCHAAQALGVDDNIGTVTVGRLADLALWDIDHPDELSYQLGYNPCIGILKGGVLRRTRE